MTEVKKLEVKRGCPSQSRGRMWGRHVAWGSSGLRRVFPVGQWPGSPELQRPRAFHFHLSHQAAVFYSEANAHDGYHGGRPGLHSEHR